MPRRINSCKKCLFIFIFVFSIISILYWKSRPPTKYQSLSEQIDTAANILSAVNISCQEPSNRVQDCESALRLADRFPQAIIIGFGKAGTRALMNFLLMHPSIQGAQVEVNYFDQYYKSEGLQWYLESFPPKRLDRINIEKSPQYIRTPETVIKLKSVLGMINVRNDSTRRFIVMMRDPITRAISEYVEWSLQRLRSQAEPLPSFDSMILETHSLPIFIQTSEYDYYISIWLEHFNLDQFCFVDGDLFIQDPYRVVKELEVCLGVPSHFRDDQFVFDQNKGFFCFRDRDQKYCLNKSKGRTHPEIAAETRDYLIQHFQIHDTNLVRITHKNFSWIR